MTLGEKILAHHAINGKGWVAPGDCIRVDVDWVIASDASWKVIQYTFASLATGLTRAAYGSKTHGTG
jgi:hypothetical protein